MKKLLPLLALLALTACKQTTAPMAETTEETLNIPECTVTAPPDSLQLDPFYTKYVDVNGLPLISSWRVPDSAFTVAHRTLHAMTSMLPKAVPDFDLRLRQCYEQAKADGILDGTYRITGTEEYFAEAIQDWFNVNAEMPYTDGKHNWCNTREELQQFDPDLYALLAEYFPNTKLQISKHKKVNEIGKY